AAPTAYGETTLWRGRPSARASPSDCGPWFGFSHSRSACGPRNQARAGAASRADYPSPASADDCPRRSRIQTIFLAMFGVEREQAALQPQRLDQFRRGRNFVALLGDHHMRKHDPVRMAQRRHHMRGLSVVEGVETAAQYGATI